MEKKQKVIYPVLLTTTADGVLIEVPDLGALSQAPDIEHAIATARDLIGIWCVAAEDDLEKELPEASSLSETDPSKGEFSKAGETVATLVDVDLIRYRKQYETKTVQRTVTIPRWLNEEARRAKVNVSAVLKEALLQKLGL